MTLSEMMHVLSSNGLGGTLFLILFGMLLVGIYAERRRPRPARREWQARRGKKWRPVAGGWKRPVIEGAPIAVFDAPEQLRCVMEATFEKRRLLNKSEARLLSVAERAISEAGLPWRAMAQVSLGEILSSPDERAYRAINSKRVDILLVAASGEPIAAIEYQGKGHHQGTAAVRDAVKKEALRRAGIGYIEVIPGDQPADVRRYIAKLGLQT
jgi:hypothetical protein